MMPPWNAKQARLLPKWEETVESHNGMDEHVPKILKVKTGETAKQKNRKQIARISELLNLLKCVTGQRTL